jgi:ABC-type branched-subunit amino acid transport system ATPase component
MNYGGKSVLKEVSIHANPETRTAIIGPTAAGKTQLLYLLTGLIKPDSGTVEFDGMSWTRIRKKLCIARSDSSLQDSILFNLTLRENIAFKHFGNRSRSRPCHSYRGTAGFLSNRFRKKLTPSFPNAEPAFPVARSNASCWHALWR